MARKPTAKYWQKRAIALKKRLVNQSIEQYEWMAEQYEKASKNIQREIEHWYARFAENNEISLADARKLLTSRELKELKWDVEEYIEKGRTLNYSEQWAKELENASARAHISRYEALQLQMQQQAEVLYGGQLDKSDEALREVYTQGYYRTAYDFQKGFGIGSNLAVLDERRIEKVLARPWGIDDKNFSDRIWENKRKLIGTLDKTLTQSIIRGETPDKAIKEIARVMEVDKKKAGRLVMTESAFIASESQKDCYKELGVEYFEVLATLDSHTCSDCGVREGEKIPMSEYKSGITAPPFHPYCRCCTVPAFDDEFDVGERAARGADGKTYYVPGDMSYEEWKQAFVDRGKPELQEVKLDGTIRNNPKPEPVRTVEEARKALKDVVGFNDIEASLSKVDGELLIANTNQLQTLEQKFGAVHASIGTISSTHDSSAIAYVSNRTTQPTAQNLSLCPKYYQDRVKLLSIGKECVESGWSMPCALTDEELAIYTVTHEYGHMVQNVLIQRQMVSAGWEATNPSKFVDMTKRSKNAIFKWYRVQIRTVENECFSEIVQIAKDNNVNFSITENLSRYGRQNKAEFFAEVFANSQLSEPNELGKAMNIWLERKGLIK